MQGVAERALGRSISALVAARGGGDKVGGCVPAGQSRPVPSNLQTLTRCFMVDKPLRRETPRARRAADPLPGSKAQKQRHTNSERRAPAQRP